ncbi:Na+/H+ antiporter NhaA [Plantactinospora sp. KBS50]|uniref:Na+/H+ antiporter NhaA n=1 Tax=Plantactinospora sp. KBS50 TaxID=2024580 RepID=UPI001E64C4AB|nr:Na+/H+ antiporter NhaA [Plantactinospora sp. KBS50]
MTHPSATDRRSDGRRLFAPSSWPEARFVAGMLRTETVGGLLLLLGAVAALVWANSPWSDAYGRLARFVPWPGGHGLHLDLSLQSWAADGLLAIFFFVVGLELKREFVAGELRNPRQAVLPVVAAVGGMVLPALVYVAINTAAADGAPAGWAVPTATDIAFALAVLAVVNSHLPQGLRAFLLTMAVVDDLFAITIIAIFYTEHLSVLPLVGAVLPIVAFGFLLRTGRGRWWLLLPLGLLAWGLVHASGVHATVAGVLLGFVVPVRSRTGRSTGEAERLEHRWRPISAGVAVPVFAFFAAGVSLRGVDPARLFGDPVVLGVVAGLVFGKAVGLFGSTYLVSRWTRAELDGEITWSDLLGVALLGGIGFTVSLLIGGLAFGVGTERDDHIRAAVLLGSAISAVLATAVLRRRNRVYRRIAERQNRDADRDGVPDIYQDGPAGS